MSTELYTLYGPNYNINNGDVLVAECLARRFQQSESSTLSDSRKSAVSGKRYKSVLAQKLRAFYGGDYR